MYDGEIIDQALAGGTGVFMCHQQNEALCSGWLACHGPDNLLALRINRRIDPSVFSYETTIPVFSSGEEAAIHGMRDIHSVSEAANKAIARLEKKQAKRL